MDPVNIESQNVHQDPSYLQGPESRITMNEDSPVRQSSLEQNSPFLEPSSLLHALDQEAAQVDSSPVEMNDLTDN